MQPASIIYHAFLAAAAGPELAQPASARGHATRSCASGCGKGVDGFRVDVIWHLIKDAEFRDNPPNPDYREGRPPHESDTDAHTRPTGPRCTRWWPEMRRVIDEFDDRVLIGEIYLPFERLVAYYGNDLRGAQMPFNFALLSTLWSARSIEKIVADYEAALPPGAWPNWVLGNHDRPRMASRVGAAQARVAAMLLLTLRGTPTIYYGDEIGMHQVAIAPDQVQDPSRRTCRESASAAMAAGRRCNGTRRAMRDSRQRSHGCRWPMIFATRTSPISMPTRNRSCISTRR